MVLNRSTPAPCLYQHQPSHQCQLMSLTAVARQVGVDRSQPGKWRSRYSDFPSPAQTSPPRKLGGRARTLWCSQTLLRWLEDHSLPNRLMQEAIAAMHQHPRED